MSERQGAAPEASGRHGVGALDGQVALVTGSTRGIGAALAAAAFPIIASLNENDRA